MNLKEQNIMLIGFMGVGKTTVSHELSRVMDTKEIDMDAYIVEYEGMNIADIFKLHGEEYFRTLETKCLVEIQKKLGRVVSCGGGVVLRDENVEYMKKNGIIVLLTATAETIFKRVRYSTDRPVLNGNMNVEYISELINKRKKRYFDVADIIIETDDKEVSVIVKEIILKINEFYK